MKKKLNNLLNLTLCFVLICGMFLPLMVLAEGEWSVTLKVENTALYSLAKSNNNEIIVTNESDNSTSFIVVQRGSSSISNDISLNCSSTSCNISVPDSFGDINFNYQSSNFGITAGNQMINLNEDIMKANSITLDIKEPSSNNDNNNNQFESFDGKAVLVWNCDNKICYHEFNSLKSDEVNYIKASEVSDDRNNSNKFNVHASEKFFAVKKEFDKRKAEIDANSVSINDLKGPEGIDYMPVGEPIENNALVSYGNREFKAIVYGEDFKGVSIGNLSELDYYPSSWNDWFLRRETYDISSTTKEKPVEIDTILLQKKINLKLQTFLNNYSVSKIEALDVPSDAVKITKKSDGSYDFEFASNYYDKVIFKITTSDNKEQYIYINRRTIDPWIRTDNNKSGIVVETFYDRVKSYSDLDVIAKIVYKDGTSKVVHLSAEKGIDDGLGNIFDDYEIDEQTFGDQNRPKGKGMKRANFVYSMSKEELKKVDKIYINVEFKGSTSTAFAGNFVGSGKGNVIEMKYWEDRLN